MDDKRMIDTAYDLLEAGDHAQAGKVFREILSAEPHYVPALRGLLFSNLKISKFSQIKEVSTVKMRKQDIEAFETAAPGDYKSYFSGIKLLLEIKGQIQLFALETIELNDMIKLKQEELDKVSATKAKARLLTREYAKIPTIAGPILFLVALLYCVGQCAMRDDPWYFKVGVTIGMCGLPFFLSLPAILDLDIMSKAPKKTREIEEKYGDVEGKLNIVKEKMELLDGDFTSLYKDLYLMDERIKEIVDQTRED